MRCTKEYPKLLKLHAMNYNGSQSEFCSRNPVRRFSGVYARSANL